MASGSPTPASIMCGFDQKGPCGQRGSRGWPCARRWCGHKPRGPLLPGAGWKEASFPLQKRPREVCGFPLGRGGGCTALTGSGRRSHLLQRSAVWSAAPCRWCWMPRCPQLGWHPPRPRLPGGEAAPSTAPCSPQCTHYTHSTHTRRIHDQHAYHTPHTQTHHTPTPSHTTHTCYACTHHTPQVHHTHTPHTTPPCTKSERHTQTCHPQATLPVTRLQHNRHHTQCTLCTASIPHPRQHTIPP